MPYDNEIPRRSAPYYGPWGGAYPSYQGLNSGINFMGGDALPTGAESMFKSLQDIQSMEYEDEKERQDKFNKLVEVSMKDVKGKWRDEAVAAKDQFIKKARDIAMETGGRLNWEQTKQLEKEKESLQSIAGMSQEIQDWYAKATLETLKLKDYPEQMKQQAENIRRIMEDSGGIKKTWDAIQNPDWMVAPEKNIDWNKDILPKIPISYDTKGYFRKGDAKQAVKDAINTGDKTYTKWFDQWKQMGSNANLSEGEQIDKFAEAEATRASFWADEPKAPVWKPTQSDQEKKKAVYQMDDNQTWRFGNHLGTNKGVGLASITIPKKDKDGNVIPNSGTTFNDARMEEVQVEDVNGVPTPMVRITFKQEKETNEQEMFAAYKKLAPNMSDAEILGYMAISKQIKGEQASSGTQRGVIMLPYKNYAKTLENEGVILEGIDYYMGMQIDPENDVAPPPPGNKKKDVSDGTNYVKVPPGEASANKK